MHESSLGTDILDFLTGKPRPRTIYEDLRQAMIAWFATGLGFPPENMQSHLPVPYTVDSEIFHRRADLVVYDRNPQEGGVPLVLSMFCPGQIETYIREVTALARLLPPLPCAFALVTDMKEMRLFETGKGTLLAKDFCSMPQAGWFYSQGVPRHGLEERARMAESRILHAYTGFLKDCCGETCTAMVPNTPDSHSPLEDE